MNLIDADKLYDYISDVFTEFGDVMSVKDALEAVEFAPTVNAVELPCNVGDTVYVVRCSKTGFGKHYWIDEAKIKEIGCDKKGWHIHGNGKDAPFTVRNSQNV